MIHSLQQFIAANTPACIAGALVIAALTLRALRYGRRHEQRTRDRGSAL